ncbi:MAG: GNAT family N-acetyltransferase [Myxococcales bacterium]|nr:GNAT family N-acetyltransferase [Myxococcales bacterium]
MNALPELGVGEAMLCLAPGDDLAAAWELARRTGVASLGHLLERFPALPEGSLLVGLGDGAGRLSALTVVEALPWDTSIFGMAMGMIPSLEVGPLGSGERLARAAVDEAIRRGFRHLSARAQVEDRGSLWALEAAGFRAMDVVVELQREAGGESAVPVGQAIDPAHPDDLPALEALSATAFERSRYFADPALPREASEELHRRWIANDCRGRAAVVLVARDGRAPIGYIACLLRDDNGVIDLIAVQPEARGRQVGRALCAAALDWFRTRCRKIVVRTQIHNLRAIAMYQTFGFRIAAAQMTLHRSQRG